MALLKNRSKEGTTIIEVTHTDTYADYCDRDVNLKDGWMETSSG